MFCVRGALLKRHCLARFTSGSLFARSIRLPRTRARSLPKYRTSGLRIESDPPSLLGPFSPPLSKVLPKPVRRSGFPLQHARSVRSLVTRIHLLVVLHVHRTLLLRRLCTIRVVMVLLEDIPLEIRCLQAEWQEMVPT